MGIGWMFERKGFHDFIKIGKMFPEVAFVWFGSKNKMLNTKKINKSINKRVTLTTIGRMSCRYKVGHVNRTCQEKRAFQGE